MARQEGSQTGRCQGCMTGKKRTGGEKKPTTVVANNPDDLKGVLKQIGGSRSDHWNNILGDQALRTTGIIQRKPSPVGAIYLS
jgi:hypothetical protein